MQNAQEDPERRLVHRLPRPNPSVRQQQGRYAERDTLLAAAIAGLWDALDAQRGRRDWLQQFVPRDTERLAPASAA